MHTITHHTGQLLAENVNEETTRRVLRNIGPCACTVHHSEFPEEGINGTEWIIDNPGNTHPNT